MKIIQVVPTVKNESDGVGVSVRGMSGGLGAHGVEVSLHCLDDVPERVRDSRYEIVNYQRLRYPFSSIGRSSGMFQGLKKTCQVADIIHTNGLWMMPNIYPAWAIRGTKCKLVVQPHGTLSKWAMHRSWWKKLPLWWLWQKRVLDKAEMLVATCEKEYKEIRAQGYKQPVAIVPIGMDLPVPMVKGISGLVNWGIRSADAQDEARESQSQVLVPEFRVEDNVRLVVPKANDCEQRVISHQQLVTKNTRLRRIVFFGRVHKVKAVDHLVKAWGQLQVGLPDWELVIAGPDCGAKRELETIIAEQQIPRVRFVGEINGPAKYDFLTEADIYVLPSHTENFGVTVAEALACGTPTIASQGTPWEGLEAEQCGKWVPIGVESLTEALRELTSLTDEERTEMGKRGRAWIQRDFSWDGIGAKMKAAYAWLLGQGEKPNFVRVD